MNSSKPTRFMISLPNELARFVHSEVETGRYHSVVEVIREALRLLATVQSGAIRRHEPRWTLSGTPYDRRKAIEAMRGIRAIAATTRLSGLSIEDLKHDGHDV